MSQLGHKHGVGAGVIVVVSLVIIWSILLMNVPSCDTEACKEAFNMQYLPVFCIFIILVGTILAICYMWREPKVEG